jgi:hypothetical protein
VARRYGNQVDLWSVWNEPNHPQFLAPQFRRGRPASPRLYRRLFQAAEREIHGVPGVDRDLVLFGETAPIGNQHLVSPLGFLRGAMCLNKSWRKRASCAKLRIDGYAHHPYASKRNGGPLGRSDGDDDVNIGSLRRLVIALDKAARAGAIARDRGIYLTEFGVQSRPDRLMGVSLARQAEYLAIAEHIAYVNPRVKSFSQYLLRDDAPRPGPKTERYSGFETGLRRSDGWKKPSYNGFLLPLRVIRSGAVDVVWGRVRPARTTTDVVIERNVGNGWTRAAALATTPAGVLGMRLAHRARVRYRLRWQRPDGRTVTGPPIRPY